jgi:hypothetical protein
MRLSSSTRTARVIRCAGAWCRSPCRPRAMAARAMRIIWRRPDATPAQGPQRWHLQVTLADPATRPMTRPRHGRPTAKTIDAGTLVLDHAEPQESGPCRDINYDPLVLPAGIEASDDPLLPARSAAYADFVSAPHQRGSPLARHRRGACEAGDQAMSASAPILRCPPACCIG